MYPNIGRQGKLMRRIVVSDIFGKTPELAKLCKALSGDVVVIDPYAGANMNFQTEEQAYAFFMANMGLNTYSDLLRSRLERIPPPATLIGFSVGASAVWQISESLNAEKVKRAICFYGSQIRHLTEVNPSIMVEYVLPMYEPGFSVEELASRLSGKKNVVIHETQYLHGFMNELSRNFNESGYTRYIDWLRRSAV